MTQEHKDEGKNAVPNAAGQGLEEYLRDRFSALPPIVLQALGVGYPGSGAGGYVELALREEYWRLRCDALEQNLTRFVRNYLAACNVIGGFMPESTDIEIREIINSAVEKLPDVIEKTPEV